MTIRNRNLLRIALVVGLAAGCGRDLTDDPIPFLSFPNVTINLGFPEYLALSQDRGFKNISVVSGVSIGVRGVIIYRVNSALYNVFEVNCSYHPNDAAANISMHPSGLFLQCSGKAGTLIMSINPTLPPLQFVDDKGELKGMRVELANE